MQRKDRTADSHGEDAGLHHIPGPEHTAQQGAALDKIGWDRVDVPFFVFHRPPNYSRSLRLGGSGSLLTMLSW